MSTDKIYFADENFISKEFVTSSQYKGNWNDLENQMDGIGEYKFSDGTVYYGEFSDGKFHGSGTMQFPNGYKINGKWQHNEMVEHKVEFSDGLKFEEENWEYLKDCSIRNKKCTKIQASSKNMLCREIPPEGYDTMDGIYMPASKCMVDYEDWNKIVRIPSELEATWIQKFCRKGVFKDSDSESLSDFI